MFSEKFLTFGSSGGGGVTSFFFGVVPPPVLPVLELPLLPDDELPVLTWLPPLLDEDDPGPFFGTAPGPTGFPK